MKYRAYLSGLDMLVAIALMLPFVFLLAYSAHSVNWDLHTYALGMMGSLSQEAKLQNIVSSGLSNATAFGTLLGETFGGEYGIARAPQYPTGSAPVDTFRLAVIGNNVYYIESDCNESADVN